MAIVSVWDAMSSAQSQMTTPNSAHLTGLATGSDSHGRLQPRWGLKFGRLTVLTGPARGRGFDVTKSQVTVGRVRGEVATIRCDRDGFSFSLTAPGWVDTPAAWLNGRRVRGGAHPLHDGDVIEMAGVQLEFVEIF